MHLVVIDKRPDARASLLGKAREAIRQVDVRRVEPVELDPADVDSFDWSLAMGCVVGPGCGSALEQIFHRVRSRFPTGKIAVIMPRESYVAHAMELRKKLDCHVLAEGDLAQLAGFVIDSESLSARSGEGFKNRGVVSVCHFKGGVGATSVAAAFGSCWARHGLNVVAVDLDDVNPQLTAWARVGPSQRAAAGRFLRAGEVPAGRLGELLSPVEGFDGRFLVVGQPERYDEGFHFKANVLDDAPSASEYMRSLVTALRQEFDAVVVDAGRSWGVATFATLPLCQKVVLVTDDDGLSVRRTLDCLVRLREESGDGEEFDLAKWALLLNAHTGLLIRPEDLDEAVRALDVFPPDADLFTLPFSGPGRQWGAPGVSLYDAADERTKDTIRAVAAAVIPYLYESGETRRGRLGRRLRALRP